MDYKKIVNIDFSPFNSEIFINNIRFNKCFETNCLSRDSLLNVFTQILKNKNMNFKVNGKYDPFYKCDMINELSVLKSEYNVILDLLLDYIFFSCSKEVNSNCKELSCIGIDILEIVSCSLKFKEMGILCNVYKSHLDGYNLMSADKNFSKHEIELWPSEKKELKKFILK